MTKEQHMPEHPIIVVGYDGTPAARAAVGRGVERVRDGGRLLVVRAYEIATETAGGPFGGAALEDAADAAARSIGDLADADARMDFIEWERIVHQGAAAEVLCRIAAERDADELIVGTRGLDRYGVLLGSVASEVLHLADRPVTVIPERMLTARAAR
jgi:nucleotide-binding universal stress UspA family protein